MPNWDKQVPGCFSSLFFVGHPAEENRAFEWLIDLRKRGVGWNAVRAQLEAFLTSNGAEPGHIKEQIEDAQTKMKPWLLD